MRNRSHSLMVRIALACCVPLMLAQGCPAPAPTDSGQTPDDTTPPDSSPDQGDPDGSFVPTGVELPVPNEGAAHVPIGTQAQYIANPPASGPHWAGAGAPAAPGVYADRLEEEQWIHNLEHGYVVVLYDCGGACEPGFAEALQSFYDAAPDSSIFQKKKIVITPYSPLPTPVMAVAWNVQMRLDDVDEKALLAFYSRHVDQGPELAP